MWFSTLTGFNEESPQQVRTKLRLDGNTLTSLVNGRSWICGELQMPSLAELRQQVQQCGHATGKLSVREVIADVQHLHTDPSNAGALFQVASQFNLLEMVSPSIKPEQGVDIYEHDHTQGPACAIAAGAGTIFRNYFALVDRQLGQSASRQIDCLADVGTALGNIDNRLWVMRNGYALPSRQGLQEIAQCLSSASATELDQLRQLLRIGLHWNTQVTLADCQHLVTQAYCSAVPVAYSRLPSELWTPFAKLILDAAYEATVCAAILNMVKNGKSQLYLTLLGGGAFGNQIEWIMDSIKRALLGYQHVPLDVAIVSRGRSQVHVQQLVDSMS